MKEIILGILAITTIITSLVLYKNNKKPGGLKHPEFIKIRRK